MPRTVNSRQHIAFLAAGLVAGRMVNSGHFTFRKGSGVKARRVMRVFIEPEADRVLWLHIRVLYVLVGPTPRGLRQSASTSRLYEWHDQKRA